MNRVTSYVGALCLTLSVAGAALAQNPTPPAAPQQPGGGGGAMPMRWQRPGRPMMNQQRRTELLQEIQQRFAQRVQAQLELTDQQMDRLRTVMQQGRDQRQQLAQREQDLRRAIATQLQPGVAADQDSLAGLLDAVAANHVARAQLQQQELRSLSFLTPVQRARLLLMRQQLMNRIQMIRAQRMRAGGGGRGLGGGPGAGPGPMGQGPGPF